MHNAEGEGEIILPVTPGYFGFSYDQTKVSSVLFDKDMFGLLHRLVSIDSHFQHENFESEIFKHQSLLSLLTSL